jgi:hypothetical protein
MPIAEKALKNLKVTNQEGREVDLLLLRWPPEENQYFAAIPCRTSAKGIILALPKNTIGPEMLEKGQEALSDEMVGPSQVVTTILRGDDDEEPMVDILMVEFNLSVRHHLDRKTSRTRRLFTGFAADVRMLPSIQELDQLVESWLESGEARLEEYHTAEETPQSVSPKDVETIFTMLAKLESRLDQMQSSAHTKEVPRPPVASKAAPSAHPELDEEALMDTIRDTVRPKPARLMDEPGRQTAADLLKKNAFLEESFSSANMDDLMKLEMLKLMKELQGGKTAKKTKKLPGLSTWEDSSSNDEGTSWSSTSKGGRGIEAVEKWRTAMRNHPEAYQERMEQRMMKAVDVSEMDPTVPAKYIKSIPVGRSKTAGYAIAGFAEILKYMLENKPRQARLHTLRMLAAFEQFTIDESWVVASRICGAEEPPWGHWATQDLNSLRKQYVYNRLSEATWVGALINELKEEEWLIKKRSSMKGGGKGDGKTAEKDKNAKSD